MKEVRQRVEEHLVRLQLCYTTTPYLPAPDPGAAQKEAILAVVSALEDAFDVALAGLSEEDQRQIRSYHREARKLYLSRRKR